MLTVVYRNKFKKNLDLLIKLGNDPEKIKLVIIALVNEQPLDPKQKDHPLISQRRLNSITCSVRSDNLNPARLTYFTLPITTSDISTAT